MSKKTAVKKSTAIVNAELAKENAAVKKTAKAQIKAEQNLEAQAAAILNTPKPKKSAKKTAAAENEVNAAESGAKVPVLTKEILDQFNESKFVNPETEPMAKKMLANLGLPADSKIAVTKDAVTITPPSKPTPSAPKLCAECGETKDDCVCDDGFTPEPNNDDKGELPAILDPEKQPLFSLSQEKEQIKKYVGTLSFDAWLGLIAKAKEYRATITNPDDTDVIKDVVRLSSQRVCYKLVATPGTFENKPSSVTDKELLLLSYSVSKIVLAELGAASSVLPN